MNENMNKMPELTLGGEMAQVEAPTLVLETADGFEKYKGVSEIKGWLMSRGQ